MSNIEKIRQEIERLKTTNPSEYNYNNAEGYIWAMDDILAFIDSLPEESQMPMPEDTVIFQKGVAEGRRLEREDRNDDNLPRFYGD